MTRKRYYKILLTWNSFIGQLVYLNSRKGRDGLQGVQGGNRYFSQLRALLYQST